MQAAVKAKNISFCIRANKEVIITKIILNM